MEEKKARGGMDFYWRIQSTQIYRREFLGESINLHYILPKKNARKAVKSKSAGDMFSSLHVVPASDNS